MAEVVTLSPGRSNGSRAENLPRVLFMVPQPFFTDRGSPMRVRSTVTGLLELGYLVDLLVYPFGEELSLPGLRIFRGGRIPGIKNIPIGPSWTKIGFDAFLFSRARSLLRSNRYQVIHGVEEAAVMACFLGRLHKTPFIFDMHSWMSEHVRHSRFVRSEILLNTISGVEAYCIRRAGGVITVGDEITSRARTIAPRVPCYSLEDLPLASAGITDSEEVSRLRRELIRGDNPVIVYTGNFASYQGVDLLIQAFAYYLKANRMLAAQDIPRLVLVGGGDPSSADCQRVHLLVRELGLTEQIIFAGQRSESEMGTFMALADVLASPRTDGTNPPLKIYSYMAASRLILATRIRSHTQILNDTNAFLTPPTAEGLAQGLVDAFNPSPENGRRRRECIAAAKHLADTRYCKAEFMRRLGELYGIVTGRESLPALQDADLDPLKARHVVG